MVEYVITRAESGKKLHRFVRQALPRLPLSGVYKWIRTGKVKVNRRKGRPDLVLQEGDVVQLFVPEEEYEALRKSTAKFRGVPRDLEVVYEDGDLLAVNKPPGLLTHPDRTEHKDTLINRVLAYLYDTGQWDGRAFSPAAVNRLDRNTSGLVLIGKHAEALRELGTWIRDRRVEKKYIALVHGRLERPGVLRDALTRDPVGNRTRTVPVEMAGSGALAAETRYRPVAQSGETTLLEVELHSGRTHQIRAHLAGAGYPLVGDVKYGGRPAAGLHHQFLHAHWVRLPNGLTLRAPLPVALLRCLERLGYDRGVIEEMGG